MFNTKHASPSAEANSQTLTSLPFRGKASAFSRDGIERIVRKHAAVAAETCPSILGKRVSPHTLRH